MNCEPVTMSQYIQLCGEELLDESETVSTRSTPASVVPFASMSTTVRGHFVPPRGRRSPSTQTVLGARSLTGVSRTCRQPHVSMSPLISQLQDQLSGLEARFQESTQYAGQAQ